MMFKRILSAVTVLAMTFSMASVIPSAAEEVPTVQNSAQIANDKRYKFIRANAGIGAG